MLRQLSQFARRPWQRLLVRSSGTASHVQKRVESLAGQRSKQAAYPEIAKTRIAPELLPRFDWNLVRTLLPTSDHNNLNTDGSVLGGRTSTAGVSPIQAALIGRNRGEPFVHRRHE